MLLLLLVGCGGAGFAPAGADPTSTSTEAGTDGGVAVDIVEDGGTDALATLVPDGCTLSPKGGTICPVCGYEGYPCCDGKCGPGLTRTRGQYTSECAP